MDRKRLMNITAIAGLMAVDISKGLQTSYVHFYC